MPTYEYKCFACGNTFEKFQSITAAPIRKCVECGKAKVKRLLGTGAGLIFKGSGFYITDYRSESYKSGEKGETPTSTADAKPDSKGEGKPEAKAESKSTGGTEPAAPKPVAKPESSPRKSQTKPSKNSQ